MHLKAAAKYIMIWIVIIPYLSFAKTPSEAVRQLKTTARAYQKSEYKKCHQLAAKVDLKKLKNPDVLLLLQGQCLFYSRQYQRAQKIFKKLKNNYPKSPHAKLAAVRLADSLWEIGNKRLAASHYKKTNPNNDKRIDPVIGYYRRVVEALERKQSKQAVETWIFLKTYHPEHPLLTVRPKNLEQPSLSLSQALTSAKILHTARRWEDALEVIKKAPPPKNKKEKYKSAFRIGRIFFDMRDRYQEAYSTLTTAKKYAYDQSSREEAWFWSSRALSRLDRDQESIKSHLEMVNQYPKGQYAPRALFYAGWLDYNQNNCNNAIPIFSSVVKRYPDSKWAQEAAWFSAWCQIKNKAWQKAIDKLSTQRRSLSVPLAGQALYWTGYAYHQLSNTNQAQKFWHKTIQRAPLSWYSLLARARLGKTAPQLNSAPRRQKHTPVKSNLLLKAKELIGAEIFDLARHLLRHNEEKYLNQHSNFNVLASLLDTYRDAGDYNRAWLLAIRKGYGSLLRLPTTKNIFIWEHSYAKCARDLLHKHVGSDPQTILFLQAIMRTESGFDPLALSNANARGLLQVYPPTADRITAKLNIEYTQDDLFIPDTNIQLASWILVRLLHFFENQWPLAAAAYNSQPEKVIEWMKKNKNSSLDIFVESIPYTETRRYAKRVTEAFARYLYLEGHEQLVLNLNIDYKITDKEIDF
jgi:soluble lytic murein transglycosylase